MQKSSILLYVLAAVGLIILYAGLAEKKVLFIGSPRAAAISLAAVGFLMCSVGALGVFLAKAPAHPMTITGYVLGTLALLAGIVQIFSIKMPLLSEPKVALLVIAFVIAVKFIIARLSFLIALKP